MHCEPNTGNVHWCTPPDIIKALTTAMGKPFDLDPCGCVGSPYPTAKRTIYLPEDGLSTKWHGTVFCNPPYGNEVGAWLSKMAEHRDGIALVHARTDTIWFHKHATRADAILFKKGRIKFLHPDGSMSGNTAAPSMFLAYGDIAVGCLLVGCLLTSDIPGHLMVPAN